MIYATKCQILSDRRVRVYDQSYNKAIIEAEGFKDGKIDVYVVCKTMDGDIKKILLPLNNMNVKLFMNKQNESFGLKAEYEENEISLKLWPSGSNKILSIFKRFPSRNKKFEDEEKMVNFMTKDITDPLIDIVRSKFQQNDGTSFVSQIMDQMSYGYSDKIQYCLYILSGSNVDIADSSIYGNGPKLLVILMDQ